MSDQGKVPAHVSILTLSGILPFILSVVAFQFPALLVGGTAETNPGGFDLTRLGAAASTVLYGVAILSFMAGARWGDSLRRNSFAPSLTAMVAAVLPALLAWVAGLVWFAGSILSLAENPLSGRLVATGCFLLAGGFCLQLAADLRARFPDGYVRLRWLATAGAVISLCYFAGSVLALS